MKTHVRIVYACISLLVLLATTSATASFFMSLEARIPFAFTAGTTALPAGTYTVNRLDGSQGVLFIRGRKGGVYLLSQSRESDNSEESLLVFKRYGNEYFLRAVRFSGSGGYSLPETKRERELLTAQKEQASTVVVSAAGGLSRVDAAH
jgi:hypothetical protein